MTFNYYNITKTNSKIILCNRNFKTSQKWSIYGTVTFVNQKQNETNEITTLLLMKFKRNLVNSYKIAITHRH